MLWNWPLLDGVDKIGMGPALHGQAAYQIHREQHHRYGWYFRNLFSAHEGELIVLQDPWKCIYHEDMDEVLFHEQFALNKEQWREALKLKKETKARANANKETLGGPAVEFL